MTMETFKTGVRPYVVGNYNGYKPYLKFNGKIYDAPVHFSSEETASDYIKQIWEANLPANPNNIKWLKRANF